MNGTLQESDLDNIKIEILKNRQQIDELKLSYSSGISVLSELTGKKLNDSLKIEMPEVDIPDTGALQRAELKNLEAQETSYQILLINSRNRNVCRACMHSPREVTAGRA